MKTQWRVCVMVVLCCAAVTQESTITRRKRPSLKLLSPKFKLTRHSSSSSLTSAASSSSVYSPLSFPADFQSDFAAPQDVSVTCSASDFVLRVKPTFYGQGAEDEELSLGSGCRSNGVLRPSGDLLFIYPLTACGAVRELPHGFLVYKLVLHYRPSARRFPTRAQPIDVDVECRYQRQRHVAQLAVKPTWKTALMHKKLKGRPSDFRMELMDEFWKAPAGSHVFQLGQTINFQVSAPYLPPGGKLYISSCHATPSMGSESSLNYTIIDNFGCLLDSKQDPTASQFIHRTDKTVKFSLKAFQFSSDPETEVSIHCKLSVTSDEPNPAHKSCTYKGNKWKALTGDDSICECCDSQCVTSKLRRDLMTGFASSELRLVSDQPYVEEDEFLPVASSMVFISSGDQIPGSRHTQEPTSREYLWKSTDVLKYGGDADHEEDDSVEEELDGDELESRVQVEETSEPDVEESFFSRGALVEGRKEAEGNDFSEFDRDGSGYGIEEEEEEEEEEGIVWSQDSHDASEGKESNMSVQNQTGGGVLHHREQSERVTEGRQKEESVEIGMYADGDEEDNRTGAYEAMQERHEGLEDMVNHDDMTWYFTWR